MAKKSSKRQSSKVQIFQRTSTNEDVASLSLRWRYEGKRYTEALGISVLTERGKRYATTAQRELDREVWKIAEEYRAKKEVDLLGGLAEEFIPNRKARRAKQALFLEYYDKVASRKTAKNTKGQYSNVRKYLVGYIESLSKDPQTFSLVDIDSTFCIEFDSYMQGKISKQTKKPLSVNTINTSIKVLKAVLHDAEAEDLIQKDPSKKLKIRKAEVIKGYLTASELKAFSSIELLKELDIEVHRAFLFSCYSGLRVSDIRGLVWSDVERIQVAGVEVVRVRTKAQKTGKPIIQRLNSTAISYLGVRPKEAKKEDKVFSNLPSNPTITNRLGVFALLANIEKELTFHCSRHTFATMLLAKGANISEIKKALGHSDIQTTARYLHSLDEDLHATLKRLDE